MRSGSGGGCPSGEGSEGLHRGLLGELSTWLAVDVSGDRIRLQEVLVNLISNAVRHAAADLPRWVEVGYEDVVPPDVGQPVRAFYVRDNGTAIWVEQQADAFRLLDEPGARGGGAGAGLTISRRIVERHGGRLWVSSVPDQGTTFYFTV